MSEKYKSTSPSAIQVKNRRTTISTEEKLNIISQLEKGERIVDKCLNVRVLMLTYIQIVIMLTELQKVLSQFV